MTEEEAMRVFSKFVLAATAAALVAGCGIAPHRSGKGNDHLVMYRSSDGRERKVAERDVVYVREPVQERYVYYEPVPAYRVVTPRPAYGTVTARPAYRYDPVTGYYYYPE